MTVKSVTGVLVAVFAASVVSFALAGDKASGKSKAGKKAPVLEKIEFVHWKKGFAKPPCNNDGICDPGENPSCGDCKNNDDGGEEPSSTCYGFMGKYGKRLLKWKNLPVDYVINPEVPEGVDVELFKAAVAEAAAEWDEYTEPEVFANAYTVSSSVKYGVLDGSNAITFGDYPTAGVIGVTSVWYNPATKTIVEFDIEFDTDWTWGDATTTATTDPESPEAVMDLQNIATHELGHALGLDDVYKTECAEVTMYGYSDNEETSKRTIEEPDIIGVTTLYE